MLAYGGWLLLVPRRTQLAVWADARLTVTAITRKPRKCMGEPLGTDPRTDQVTCVPPGAQPGPLASCGRARRRQGPFARARRRFQNRQELHDGTADEVVVGAEGAD